MATSPGVALRFLDVPTSGASAQVWMLGSKDQTVKPENTTRSSVTENFKLYTSAPFFSTYVERTGVFVEPTPLDQSVYRFLDTQSGGFIGSSQNYDAFAAIAAVRSALHEHHHQHLTS
jgi:hypothetical protein